MSIVLRRSLFFGKQNDQTAQQLYESLCKDLQTQVAERLGLQDHPEMLNSWPNSSWSNAYGSVTAEGSEWVSETSPDQRLFQVRLTEHCEDCEWKLTLALGRNGEELVLYEESSTYPPRLVVCYEQMPEMLTFLRDYTCLDEDGMNTGRVYSVMNNRVGAFADFIGSTERRLPIVLISPRQNSSNYLSTDTSTLARRLQGLAHVVKLEDDQTAQRLRSCQPNHACYDGAVRIFWPGFRKTDNPALHPHWSPQRLGNTQDVATIFQEIFASVAEKSTRIYEENPDIKFLRQQQSEQQSKERIAQVETQLKEQLRLRLQEQADAQLEELICEFDAVERERDRLREENELLDAELARSQQKLRGMRWQLNNAWQERPPAELENREAVAATILLSSKAHKQYDSLDSQERDYWDQHILRKLKDEDLRDNQTEPMEGSKETVWVYPRKRTASGRRVLYYCDCDAVYVCQLFTGAEHDGEYERLRNEGVTRVAYGDYQEWQPEGTSAD